MDEELKKILKNIDIRLEKLETKKSEVISKEITNVEKSKTMAEFLKEYNLKSEPDKALAIIYYLEKFRGLKNLTSKEMIGGFKEVRERVPKNIADKFQKLAKKAFIAPAEISGKFNTWTYTNKGKKYLFSLKNEN